VTQAVTVGPAGLPGPLSPTHIMAAAEADDSD
jgi:hypothetical protein